MKEKSQNRWKIPLILLALLFLFVLIILLGSIFSRWREKTSRPLVLINQPKQHQTILEGELVVVHAAAREQHGIQRMEVWADDVLIFVKESEDGVLNPMVVSKNWQPLGVGSHLLIVRAQSGNGVYGQSSLMVDVVQDEISEVEQHVVEEGEDFDTVAAMYEVSPEELRFVNPEIWEDELLEPGERLDIPSREHDLDEPESDVPVRPDGEGLDPPEPEVSEPGSVLELLDGIRLFLTPLEIFEGPGDEVFLKIEVLNLQTSQGYDGLHCFIGLAGEVPRWYPDLDGNPSTNDSFPYLGDGEWDAASFFAEDQALVIPWLDNEPLEIQSNCVAITSSGTDALELGQVTVNSPPEDWDGVVRYGYSMGGEGVYSLSYRISFEDSPRMEPLWLDPSMTAPTNLRLDERRISLRWDYEPEEDEEPIDGFRFYLNGNLQWVEPADSRETGLPYEWLTPPCGARYGLSVSAYRYGYPDGPESLPAMPPVIIETPLEGCKREVQITFHTLETFDLGGDGNYEDRTGDIGPAYGIFFGNEKQISFDGRSPHSGGVDLPLGLFHNWSYDLFEMYADRSWSFSGMPSTIVEVEPGGTFEFGFRIMDEDSGRCRDSNDRGCDDLICEGISAIYEDNQYGEFDQIHTGTLTSDDGRCRINYTWQPASGSPVGTGIEGWEPLPWIAVDNVEVLEGSGAVRVHVRNSGTATWPWRDLQLSLQSRDGERLAFVTWPEFVLEPGGRSILAGAELTVNEPYDACIVIDPNDLVLEEYERSGALTHQPVCVDLPDLTITNVNYDLLGGGRIRVTVQNVSDHPLVGRSVKVSIFDPNGEPLYISSSWPVDYMLPGEVRIFDLIGVTENRREFMRQGYHVVVNPDTTFAESNYENNRFNVEAVKEMEVWWMSGCAPLYGDGNHHVNMNFVVDVVRGAAMDRIGSFSAPELEYNQLGLDYVAADNKCWYDTPASILTSHFDVFGDEQLMITVNGQVRIIGTTYSLGEKVELYNLSRSDIDIPVRDFSACTSYFGDSERWYIQPPQIGLNNYPPYWSTSFKVCERVSE